VVLACAAFVAVATLAGMALALDVASDRRQQVSIGTVDSRLVPARDGHVSVFVPLVDWRVQVLDHRAPVEVAIELRSIDRDRAGNGVSSPEAATRSVELLRRESEAIVRETVRRGAVVAAIGGVAGAFLAGALLTSTRLRRRWLLASPLIGLAVVAAAVVPSVLELRELERQEVSITPDGGYAAELPTVLRFAAQLRDVGDEYERHVSTALESATNLASFAGRPGRSRAASADAETFLVVSDVHDNAFVLDAFDEYAGDSVVFGVGDWMQVGAEVEELLAPELARLGSRFIAVSGNHDTESFMRSLEAAGAEVLDLDSPYAEVGDLLVAGYPDPLERADDSGGTHRLRVYGDEYDEQRADFLEWWDDLPERPDIVLVHQHGFAHALLDHLEAEGDRLPLTILTGHDHRAHAHARGPHALVDGGSLGAGGIVAVGEQSASFAQVELVGRRPVAAQLVEVEPLTGRARSERVSLRAGDPVSGD
jgi:predicted phosphodiesterase/uncharacterized membrane protein YeaQ/YmgE (transglycosylase-associated protein family)